MRALAAARSAKTRPGKRKCRWSFTLPHTTEKRKQHIAEMQELAKRETQTWQEVENTLESGYTASNYDHATDLLNKLQQLADFQGTQANFDTRLGKLMEKYKARTALMGRWKRKGWA
jgi:flagellar biosynthesis chaperone FliJ